MFHSIRTSAARCSRVVSTAPSYMLTRSLASAAPIITSQTHTQKQPQLQTQIHTPSSKAIDIPDLTALKIDSNGSKDLYAVFKLHNMPYLVTKGDKVVLPFKLKNVEVGDLLVLNEVITLGSPEFTYQDNKGIPVELFTLNASVTEITREPYYEVYRKKQRCRRLKTFPVQNHQTIITINELKLI